MRRIALHAGAHPAYFRSKITYTGPATADYPYPKLPSLCVPRALSCLTHPFPLRAMCSICFLLSLCAVLSAG